MKQLHKKGSMIIVYMILGLALIVLTIPVVKYIKDSSNEKFFKDQGINPQDEFVPYDYGAHITNEDKLALESVNLLKEAINALAEGRSVSSNSKPTGSPIQITFDGQFEAEVSGINLHKRELCSFYLYQEGPITVDCKQYFDLYSIELKNKEPYDIDALYSFAIIGDKGSCPSASTTYPSNDLKSRGLADDCSNAPNYLISNGYKISYCGKAGWKIKINVQKTTELECKNNLTQRDGFWNGVYDSASNTGKLIQSTLGFKPDQTSNAFCDSGEKRIIGNTTICLSCDNVRNKCDLVGFELPQNITKKEADPWIAGYGDPKWVVYYESFPQGEEQAWQVSKVTAMSTVLAYSSVALDTIPLVGKLARGTGMFASILGPLVTKISNIKTAVYDATIGRVVNGVKISLPKLFIKNSDEVAESVLKEISRLGPNVAPRDVMIDVNNRIIRQNLDNVFAGAIKDTKGLTDEIVSKVDFSKYVDEAGKISADNLKKMSDDVAEVYKKTMIDKRREMLDYAAIYATENADDATRKLAGVPGTKEYQDYFWLKAEKEFAENTEKGYVALKNIQDSVKQIHINDIVFQKTLNAQEQAFQTNFKSLFKKSYEGGTLRYDFDTSMVDDVVNQLSENLAKMSPEAKEVMFEKARKMSEKFIKENDLDLTKILGEAIEESPITQQKILDDIASTMRAKSTTTAYGKIAELYSKTSGAVGEIFRTTPGQVVSGTWNRKERLIFAGIIAFNVAQMDAINEKYVPVGYNKLALGQISSGAQRKEVPLSSEAADLFIRLDKEDRDGASTNRLFFASPCKTDLDIRKQKCTCTVENVVERYNGQWAGYLKKTGSNSYVPVKNVKATVNDYKLQTFQKIDTRTMANQVVQGALALGLYSTIATQFSRDLPVLNSYVDTSYAIKECQTRGWWDSQVFAFNNVDVETDCISISETDYVLSGKYKDYNNGYNFCYSGDNDVGEALKGTILIAQTGITIAAGASTAGLGMCVAAPISNVIGGYLTNKIDDNSKWPSKNFKWNSLKPFSSGTP